GAEPFAVFADTVHVRGGHVEPPGGDEAGPLWEAVVGAPLGRPDRFLPALFIPVEGRLARLYDTIGQLDRARQRFALGLWVGDASVRLGMIRALAAASISPSFDRHTMKAQPFLRDPYDLA